MSWENILKSKPSMGEQIKNMESAFKKEFLKPLPEIYGRKEVKKLQKEAKKLIESLKKYNERTYQEYNGEVEKFNRVMNEIKYFRAGPPFEIDDLSS